MVLTHSSHSKTLNLHHKLLDSTEAISTSSTCESSIATTSDGSGDFSCTEDLDDSSTLVRLRLRRRRWEVHQSVLEVIGQTAIIRLNRMPIPSGVEVYVKCESGNPGGSLKDRLAHGVIEWAEKHGMLRPGQTVIEASSGNTGIGMAMVCASKGYPFVCVMSESFSLERRKLMRFLGARVILTPAKHKASGMLIKAQELADKHGFFYTKQFENEANAWIHEQTTGPEIAKAFAQQGKRLDHFFMAYGTGGTILGLSRAFRHANMSTKVHLCEPSNAPMVKSGIPTKYPAPGEGPISSFETAHPLWSPHLFQGWATDFIPKLLATAKEEGGFQEIEHVASGDAIATSRLLAKSEGISTGISGGGILAAALRYAQCCKKGTTILAILPDTGERYLSTVLFEGIPAEMTEEEVMICNSTPSKPPPSAPSMSGILPADTDSLFDM